jgi:DNA-binding transcriptional ArsR family regulator
MNAAMFAALGEPSRLRIVELLRQGPSPVGAIADALGIRQPQVSKHLKVLSEARIVRRHSASRQRIYHLDATAFDAIANWVHSFEQQWNARLDSLGAFLESTTQGEGHGLEDDR